MGKRYRYYVSAPDDDGFAQAGWRLPAREIERIVIDGVIGLLQDRLRLTRELDLASAAPDRIESLIREAEDLANALLKAGMVEQRKIILKIVNRIEVGPDRIRINPNGLSQRLGRSRQVKTSAGRLKIDIPVRLKRRGVEKKIVITDNNQRSARPDAKLIKAVAQGRVWFDQLKNGEVRLARDLAAKHGTDCGNVTRTLQLAFLAPDIVKAILDGRQPAELTAFHLKRIKNLPLSWAEQREMLGFAD